jgi:hypothetical protein
MQEVFNNDGVPQSIYQWEWMERQRAMYDSYASMGGGPKQSHFCRWNVLYTLGLGRKHIHYRQMNEAVDEAIRSMNGEAVLTVDNRNLLNAAAQPDSRAPRHYAVAKEVLARLIPPK